MLRQVWLVTLILGVCLTGFSKPGKHPFKKHQRGIPLSKALWDVPSPLKDSSPLSQIFSAKSENHLPVPSDTLLGASVSALKTEISTRNHLANRVLKSRLNHFLQTQVGQWNHLSFIKVQKRLDKVNDVALFSSSSQNPGTDKKSFSALKVGFDLKNNQSKIEYLEEDFKLGLCHNRTLSALTGSEPFANNLNVSLNKIWEEQKMKASLNIPFSLPYYTASISRDFTASFSSTISAQAPLKGTDQEKKVELKLSFLF